MKKGMSKSKKLKSVEEDEESIDLDKQNPENYHDLVYELQRLDKPFSPMAIVTPNYEMLYKMMRACIGVHHIDDLWFNQGANQEEEDLRNENFRKN